MKLEISLCECVELFFQRAGDKYEDPEVRAACILAAHTLKSLTSKKKKYYNQKVLINVEVEGEEE